MVFQTTRLSKVLAAVLLTLFLVEFFVPDTSDYLALVPGRTLPCVWNLVTCALLTVNPVEVGRFAAARRDAVAQLCSEYARPASWVRGAAGPGLFERGGRSGRRRTRARRRSCPSCGSVSACCTSASLRARS